MDRRRFVSLLAAGAGGIMTAALAVPLLGQVLSPLRKTVGGLQGWFSIGNIDDFPVGAPKRISFPVTTVDGWTSRTDNQSAWVRRDGPDTITVYTGICPHLGCSVEWREQRKSFLCPCHNSEFNLEGERLRGPARRGMDPLPCRLQGREVEIRWIEYAAASADRTITYGGDGEEA